MEFKATLLILIFFYKLYEASEISPVTMDPDGVCQERLNVFARATANYTMCTIQHARPISVCVSCVDNYLEVLETYRLILELYDEQDKQCKEELMNVDRLQVVDKGYTFVNQLWEKAACSECFEKDETGHTISNQTDVTKQFKSLYNTLEACIVNQKNNSNVCVICKDDYLTFNDFYNQHKLICMDIIDLVNMTRYEWSSKLGCCLERNNDELPFLLVIGSVCSLPLIFYLFVYCFSKDVEFHFILDRNRWRNVASSATNS